MKTESVKDVALALYSLADAFSRDKNEEAAIYIKTELIPATKAKLAQIESGVRQGVVIPDDLKDSLKRSLANDGKRR